MAATSIAIPPKRKMILKTLSSSRKPTVSSRRAVPALNRDADFAFDGGLQENAAFAPVMGLPAELSRLDRVLIEACGTIQTKTAAEAQCPTAAVAVR
jgi:hypothetical protein